MKRCGRCSELKSADAFARRARSSDGLQPYCRACQHETYTAYYRANRNIFREALERRNAQQRLINREYIAQHLRTHPCVDCGLTDPIVLEFDHVRGVKIANVGVMVSAPVAITTLRNEVAKCDVRCANCHRRRTARGWRYTLRKRRQQEKAAHAADIPRLLTW